MPKTVPHPPTPPRARPGPAVVLGIPVAGAALLVLLFLAYYMIGDRLFGSGGSVAFRDKDLTLLMGQGEHGPEGLSVRQVGERGMALVSGPTVSLPARLYPTFKWRVDGLSERSVVALVWTMQAAPALKALRLEPTAARSGRVDLTGVADWQGTIAGIGLAIRGKLEGPVTVQELALEPAAPRAGVLLAELWREWTAFEGWSGRSTHFIVGGTRDGLLSPVLAAAAWVALSALLYLGLMLMRRRPWSVMPLAVFFLAGWLALDARWQVDLWRQLHATRQTFAGKDWEEKRLAADDGHLFRLAMEVKRVLPQAPARIFIVSADPTGRSIRSTEYPRLRVHYHLLPHNVYSQGARPPDSSHARTGDYVLILNSIPGIELDPAEGRLRWDGRELAVERVYEAPLGSLYRVR